MKCTRVNRRFYFLSWEPDLWQSVVLDGDQKTDTDLALKTIFRLLSRNPAGKHGLSKLVLNGSKSEFFHIQFLLSGNCI